MSDQGDAQGWSAPRHYRESEPAGSTGPTGPTEPPAPADAADRPAPGQGYAPVEGTAAHGQWTYGQPTYGQPTYDQPTYAQPTYGQPTYAQPASPPSTPPPTTSPPTYDQPTYAQPGYGQPDYGHPGYAQPTYPPAATGPTGPAGPTEYLPTYAAAPAPDAAYGAPAGYGQYPPPPPTTSPKRSRGRIALVVGLVVVVVAGLAVGAWAIWFRGGPDVTWQGKQIDHPESVLAAAQDDLNRLVGANKGATNADTRCYFAVASNPPAGTAATDVTDTVYCGPALFVDGETAKPYIPYGITATPAGDDVTLSVGAQGTDDGATAVPSGQELVRPDGQSAPSGSGGLAVPEPPAADADVLLATDDVSNLPAAPDTATMAALDGGVTVTELGQIDRYGKGKDARSAPDGQKLIAFALTDASGDDDDQGASALSLGIVVDGGASRPVPDLTRTTVLAVPTDAKSVELVTAANGVNQSISLLDGKPGSGNIAVLQRANRFGSITVPGSFEFTESAPGASVQRPSTLAGTAAGLFYWSDETGSSAASAPSKAFLLTDIKYAYSTDSPAPFTGTNAGDGGSFEPQYLTLTLPDGTAIPATLVTNKSVFEVPADFTSGTITIAGAITNANNITFTVPAPGISIPVSIPTS